MLAARRDRRSTAGTSWRPGSSRPPAADRARRDRARATVVVGRDGRAKAYRPLPAERRAAAIDGRPGGLRARRLLRGPRAARAGLDGHRRPRRAGLLQGLIKLAAAYVHGVRGNPAGVARNLDGARERLLEAGRRTGRRHAAGLDVAGARSPPSTRGSPTGRRPGTARRSARPICRGARDEPAPAPSRRSTSPRPSAACARTRTGRSSSTSARPTSSPRSARPARSLVPTSTFVARVGELPTTGRCWSSATSAAAPRPRRRS